MLTIVIQLSDLAVVDGYRVGATWNFHKGGPDAARKQPLVFGKVFDSQCGRHNNQLERRERSLLCRLSSQRQGNTQQSEQDVSVQVSFMCLVQDNRAVFPEKQV